MNLHRSATFALLSLLAAQTDAAAPNELSAAEKADGWKLLFDGKTTTGWRNFQKPGFPDKGWVVEDGCLKKVGMVSGGDIITIGKFEDFDLYWEWRLGPRGNNGVKYLVTEARDAGIGHEYQMVDETLFKDLKKSTAAFYEVLPPKADKPFKPPGEWNSSRILVQGNHVEHWLNGVKVLEYECGSEEVKSGVARSKFRNVEGFGKKITGHILLTDHNDETWFRNIKIRPLLAP